MAQFHLKAVRIPMIVTTTAPKAAAAVVASTPLETTHNTPPLGLPRVKQKCDLHFLDTHSRLWSPVVAAAHRAPRGFARHDHQSSGRRRGLWRVPGRMEFRSRALVIARFDSRRCAKRSSSATASDKLCALDHPGGDPVRLFRAAGRPSSRDQPCVYHELISRCHRLIRSKASCARLDGTRASGARPRGAGWHLACQGDLCMQP